MTSELRKKKQPSGVKKPEVKPTGQEKRIHPMPDPKLLTRALPAAVSQIHSAGISELGRMASVYLEYEVLENTTRTPKELLSQTLIRLGIEVLDTKQVEEYMEKRKLAVSSGVEKLHDDDTDEEEDNNGRVDWYKNQIDRYRHPIPERVLALAIHIRKENPQVNFDIHALDRGDPDPFMSVFSGSERFYLEVWDEPKFTGVLTKLDAERAGLNNKPTE